MNMKTKLAAVDAAQADSASRRVAVATAWTRLRLETARAATPGRILGAGLIAGFVSGLRGGSGAKTAGSQIGGKLFSVLVDGAFATFGAALAAGAAAADAEHSGATDPQPNPTPSNPGRD
jgi:hypothetical protein